MLVLILIINGDPFFEPARPTDIDFVLGIVYNSTQKEYCYKGYCEQDFSIDRNGMAVNNVSWHKNGKITKW